MYALKKINQDKWDVVGWAKSQSVQSQLFWDVFSLHSFTKKDWHFFLLLFWLFINSFIHLAICFCTSTWRNHKKCILILTCLTHKCILFLNEHTDRISNALKDLLHFRHHSPNWCLLSLYPPIVQLLHSSHGL